MVGKILLYEFANTVGKRLLPHSMSINGNCLPHPEIPDLNKLLPVASEIIKEVLKSKQDEYEHQKKILEMMIKQRLYEQTLHINAEERMKIMEAISRCIERADSQEERMALLKLWQDLLTMPIIFDTKNPHTNQS